MFAKVFSQIFDSSIAESYTTRHVFMDILVLADSDGAVDMTREAISRRTNVPIEIVSRAIDALTEPDSSSRSKDSDGRRLVPLDEHRKWGWRIVNYLHYRKILDEESRRAYFRDYRKRERQRKAEESKDVQSVQVGSTEFTQGVPSASSSESPSREKESAERKRTSREEMNDWIERIRSTYPRQGAQQDCRHAIRSAIDAGHQTPEQILADVQECAKWVKVLEPTADSVCTWVPCAENFFGGRQWTDPKKFKAMVERQKEAKTNATNPNQRRDSGDLNETGRYARKPS